MRTTARVRYLTLLVIVVSVFPSGRSLAFFGSQEAKSEQPNPSQDRGVAIRPNAANAASGQIKPGASKPEIVLQPGITSPQSQVRFSPDGRLLASMGRDGNAIKLWEVASGRLLRQLDSGIPSMGGTSLVRPFRFSPDGRTLIAMADAKVRRWEVETGRELGSTSLPNAKGFFAAILSEDGRTLAATSLDSSEVRLWDTTAGRELQPVTFEREARIAGQNAIALSPNGNLLAVLTDSVRVSRKGAAETTLQISLWEVASGRKAQTLKVSSGPTQFGVAPGASACLVFSADGGLLAMRDEASIRIWDVAAARELKSFTSPGISASRSDPSVDIFGDKVLFSPDRRILSVVSGSTLNLVDASSAATSQTLAGHNGTIIAVSFSADSKLVASSAIDNQIKVWETSTGREVETLRGSAMPVSDLAFSPDGKSLSLAGHEAVSSWELITGGVRRGVALPDDYARHRQGGFQERGCLLSRDGKFVIAGSSSQPLAKVWEIATGRELPDVSLTQGRQLGNAAFSSDGSVVALVERDFQTPRSAQASQPSPQPPANVPAQPIALPDMSKIMEQMQKDPKKMQEQMKKVEEAMKRGDINAGLSALESMGVTPPTTRANKSSNNLRILDVATGRQLQAIPVAQSGLIAGMMSANPALSSSTLSFSPDGRVIATASGFNSPITLRDASTGKELRTLKPSMFSMMVYSLAWSADGKRLASAHSGFKGNLAAPNAADTFSFDDLTFSIKVWDTQTGAELNSLVGHNNLVNALAFSRDGRMLASGGYDSTIKLWDLSSGRELRTLVGHTGPISALDFSADGRFVVSGSDDGSARLWSAQTGELVATLVSVNKGDDWLVVTPDGLFDGSPAGWNQILWRFSPAIYDVSPVEIFFNEYYYPGLLPDILAGKKIVAASDISQKDRRQPKLSFDLADAGGNTGVSARTLNVRLKITEAPAGAQDVRLFRNGSLVKVWHGDVLKGQSGAALDATVSMVAGQNQLTAYAFNRDNVKSSDATIAVRGADILKRAGTLHLLMIGVNEYANSDYNLKYAVADARAFGEEIERQQRKLGGYSQIETTFLLDRDATKANLLYALKRLSGSPDAKAPPGAPGALEKIKTAEPEDAVVVYYAGHGTAQDQRFYLIPHDLGYRGARSELDEAGLKAILSHSVSDLDLEQAFEGIDAGHLLTVIDACNSGQALEAEEKRRGPMNSKGLAQLAYEKGMYILTAAQSYQAAMEAEQLGHGYLTYALVEEGLKSGAADDQPKDGQVVVREWLDYATDRVPKMQEAKMKEGRGLKHPVAFVEGEEKTENVDKRSLQRPRVFYRREAEPQPLVVARP
ncbi:MAG TPA: caspase family protein [Blastocatellia bacterium]|nr:caspase family protein [Blastocatellia bacterium]